MDVVTVAIFASDPGTREGAIALLSAHPDIAVLTPAYEDEASVVLIITTSVTEDVLLAMERVHQESPDGRPRVVLVASQIERWDLARAINAGLVVLLDRQNCGYDRIARAVLTAGAATTAWPTYIPAAVPGAWTRR